MRPCSGTARLKGSRPPLPLPVPVQVAALPPVEMKAEPKSEPKNDAPHVEPIADTPAPAAPAAEPVAVPMVASSGAKAKKIQRVETSGSGANVQVRISGDGAL